jgi:hypothetical protein
MIKRWVLSVVACSILALASTSAYGQAVFGNIVGTATDPQGAAVANAKVTVTSATKNTTTATTTNESGNFSVSHLIPDTYKVKFEAPGFKSFEQGDVPVFADSTYRVDCQFAVGSASETLEITGEPPQLQTDKSDIAIQFNNTYVQDMPTLNRNFTQFELMSPGTQQLGWAHASTENPQAGKQIMVNGQHFSGTNFELDGTDNQDPILGIIVINPNLDGVTEAKVALQQYDAEMGKAVAGYVTSQTKSGSNDFHGGGFYFRRTGANQARNPFTQSTPDSITGRFIPGSKWQQYGGSIGGPIIKNKLFFFGDYQGTTQANGITNVYSIPTAKVHATCGVAGVQFCDLSDYFNVGTGGGGGTFIDPVTGKPVTYQQGQIFNPCSNTSGICVTPLTNLTGTGRPAFGPQPAFGCSNNCIPNALISPQAVAILALFPNPNQTGNNGGTTNNYVAGGAGPFTQNAFDTREDWVATSTLNVFGRYSQSYFNISGAPGLGKAGGQGFGLNGLAGGSVIHNYSLAVGATKTFGPSWVADFRFGWFKYNPQTHKSFQGLTPMQDIGAQGLNITGQGAEQLLFTSGLPEFDSAGSSTLSAWGEGLGVGRCNCPLLERESQYQGVTNWTKIWGNHSFKFGADIRSASNLRVPSDQNRTGVLQFNSANTSSNGVGGLDVATFMLGNVTQIQRYVSTVLDASEHQWRYFFYGQDTWRLTPKLTLNYGLRWEIYMPESVNGKGNGGFANPVIGGPENGVIRVAGYGNISNSGNVGGNYHAFAPRLGLAYSMNDKTVIRMGFGVSYDIGVFGSNFGHAVTQNLPVLGRQTQQANNNPGFANASNGTIAAFNLFNGPTAFQFPIVPASGILPLGGPNNDAAPFIRPPNQTLNAIGSWNLAVQRQLTNSMTIDIAYIGNVGRHSFLGPNPNYDANPINIQNWALTNPCLANPALSGAQCNPIVSTAQRQYYFNKFSTPYTDANGVTTNVLCCSGGIMTSYFGDAGTTNYNALQIKLQQNMNHGLQFIAHYTWSHALNYYHDDASGSYFAANPRVEYGPDQNNRGQVFVFNAVYQLPFGKGKMFGGNAGRAENLIIGGWQVTSTLNYSSGLPFTPSYANCGQDEDVGVCRPSKGNLAQWSMGGGSLNPITHSVQFYTPIATMATPCTNYGAWSRPCGGTLGDTGPSFLTGPRSFTTDASIMKDFGLTERFNLQFRMDAFNLFNHPVLAQPGTCIDCAGSGLITNTDSNVTMRALQFALRLSF